PLPVSGAARDLRTVSGGTQPDVVGEVTVQAVFDTDRSLTKLRSEPSTPWVEQLLGTRAGGGFRRRLAHVVSERDAGSLLRQLLDDMPAAVLISGYGFMRLARRQGLDPRTLTPPDMLARMVDLCSGWRAGGTAMDSVAAGHGVPLQDCPPVPAQHGDDPWAFHPVPELAPDAMRRRRCLDVAPGDENGISVWATFRDSVGEPEGGEAVLHEYTAEATVRAGVVTAVAAQPRVLPFPECPAAADNVGRLVGMPLADLAVAVPELIAGTDCCTHLNDLLRALGGLAALSGSLTVSGLGRPARS
ncbi:MAG TPA: DUF2889 domain-containing protein, partial [Acidimicrobiales bacterium]|nr:DUF2889 domain-containing protein [Acidimicrobiales bacterium]